MTSMVTADYIASRANEQQRADCRELMALLAGFAIRGRDLVAYLLAEDAQQKAVRRKLGKHRMGKSRLYFRQLADLDTSVLRQLIANSIADVQRRHG